jgi:hypothetical protein
MNARLNPLHARVHSQTPHGIPTRFNRLKTIVLTSVALATLPLTPSLHAQELREHPTPHALWLDSRTLRQERPVGPAPHWFAGFTKSNPTASNPEDQGTLYRIDLRRLPKSARELELRLSLDSKTAGQTSVAVWSELGECIYQSLPPKELIPAEIPLPESQPMPSCDIHRFPADKAGYIEIRLPEDGAGLRTLFLTANREVPVLRALDFPLDANTADPFTNGIRSLPSADDSLLFGRIRATLESSDLHVRENAPSQVEFELTKQPLVAFISFETKNISLTTPPAILLNGHKVEPVSVHIPDLADPAWRPLITGRNPVNFVYTAWRKAQAALPLAALVDGVNKLEFASTDGKLAYTIRHLEIQLKYPWKKFDFNVIP